MDLGDGSGWLFITVQILFVDLLLGADNALVIALACRSLPPEDLRRTATIGIAGAIVLRLLMTIVATTLLAIPFVKIVGALALTAIAMNISGGEGLEAREPAPGRGRAANVWSAAAVIVIADAAMGIDNVVALAAIARGNFWLLALGVALSLPILGYGGVLLHELLRRAPGLVAFGAALLGWIAGDMAISDPIVAPWANANAPGLVAIAPALGAAFVYLYARFAAKDSDPRAPPKPRTAPPPKPALAAAPPAAPVAALEAKPPPRPGRQSGKTEERVVIVGALILAIAAGAFLVIVAYVDGLH